MEMATTAPERLFSIGTAARMVKRSPATLRKLEARGVITPARLEGQDRRLYTLADVEIIRAALVTRSGGNTQRDTAA